VTRSRLKRIDWATPYDGSAEDESRRLRCRWRREIYFNTCHVSPATKSIRSSAQR